MNARGRDRIHRARNSSAPRDRPDLCIVQPKGIRPMAVGGGLKNASMGLGLRTVQNHWQEFMAAAVTVTVSCMFHVSTPHLNKLPLLGGETTAILSGCFACHFERPLTNDGISM